MEPAPLTCPQCGHVLWGQMVSSPVFGPCRGCGRQLRVDTFPALLARTVPGRDGRPLIVGDNASCFFHPARQAEVICESCGRFLCALCDLEVNGRHLCSTCLEKTTREAPGIELVKERTRYDSIALTLAVLPIITIRGTLFGAPAALFVVFRYWNKPGSLVGKRGWRSRFLFASAAVVAMLEIAGWVATLAAISIFRS